MIDEIQQKLKSEFPESSDAECYRFARAAESTYKSSNRKDKNELIEETATQKLEGYLDWRSCFGIDHGHQPKTGDDDEAIWKWASDKATSAEKAQDESKRQLLKVQIAEKDKKKNDDPTKVDYDSRIDKAFQEEQEGDTTGDKKNDNNFETGSDPNDDCNKAADNKDNGRPSRTLPQIIFKRIDPKTGEMIRDKDGNLMFHVLAARIDRFAGDPDTWALAISLYLECHFDRNSKDLYSLFIDGRAGEGWANPKFFMAVSLLRTIINTVSTLHPGRWNSLIIFPLPRALLGIWRNVKGFFHPDVAEVIKLVSGPSSLGSPLPKDDLEAYVGHDTLDILEKCREGLCT
jgi:hypothetical protein